MKRLMAILLALVMVVGVLPLTALADQEPENPQGQNIVQEQQESEKEKTLDAEDEEEEKESDEDKKSDEDEGEKSDEDEGKKSDEDEGKKSDEDEGKKSEGKEEKKSEDEKDEEKKNSKEGKDSTSEIPEAVQAFLDAVSNITVPDEITDENRATLEAQIIAAYDAFDALSAEEQAREDVDAAYQIIEEAGEALIMATNGKDDYDISFFEAGDWDPTTPASQVKGTLVGTENYSTSFTFNISTSTNAQLKAMPILNSGGYSYNAMAYCDAKAVSSNKDVIDVKSISIGTWSGGEWNGADCLQINCDLLSPGTATVTAYYYYTFSQHPTPLNNPNAQWYYATHTFTIWVNKDFTLSYDANGGTGAPNAQTKTASSSSWDFTVSSQEPTWAGHTFLGWADSADATAAQYKAGDKVTVTDSKTLYAVWKEDAPPAPSKPDGEKDVKELLANGAVTIHCVNSEASHDDKTYGLLDGSYKIADPVWGEATGKYTCAVTVYPTSYVTQYSIHMSMAHTLDPDTQVSKAITLEYKDDAWTVQEGAAPVTFNVKCVTPPTFTYTLTYDANAGGATVTGMPSPNLVTYSGTETTHIFTVSTATPARVGYTFKGWSEETNGSVLEGNQITLTSTSPTKTLYAIWEANAPDTFTLTYDANGGTGAPSSQSGIAGNFTISATEPTRTQYVFMGWATESSATTASYQPEGTITITANTTLYAVWEADLNGNGVPDKNETTYTVTYTDGVDGAVIFEDQVYANCLVNTATPAFNGTPTRSGYVFAGWDPEWEDTVTESVTYKATWDEDINGNGIADKNEDKYTVTYTDGVIGTKVFDDQVYSGLLSGTKTPAFVGTPTRTGYVFAGWVPAVAEAVTENVTYVATWQKVSSSGLDNVPKTGDTSIAMIGGLMLFALCGGTAVYVIDRKKNRA